MPRSPEVAPDHPADAGSAAPPAGLVAGDEALRVALPPGKAPASTPAPSPSVDLANVRPLMGQAVPAAPPPGRSINLGEILDQYGRMTGRIEKMEAAQLQLFADIRKRVDAEVGAMKKYVAMLMDEIVVRTENRSREIGQKIDERYAGKFAQVADALDTLAKGCAAMTEAHKLIADAAEQANKASKQAGMMAAKIDILDETVGMVRAELGSDIDAVRAELKGAVDKAVADSSTAAKEAHQAAKDLMTANGRIVQLEGFRDRQVKQGAGRRG